MTSGTILLVEDDPALAELLRFNFEREEFEVTQTPDGEEAMLLATERTPDIILLDWMLESLSGIEVCRRLRRDPATANIPIIMLTARAEEGDRIRGLETGADDYVTKPFSPRELIARVKAVLRRLAPIAPENLLKICAGLTLDLKKYEVRAKGQPLTLTATEFNILKILAMKPGHVFSREYLLEQLWGEDKIVVTRTIDVHIKNLREKLGEFGTLIRNLRGVGYKLEL